MTPPPTRHRCHPEQRGLFGTYATFARAVPAGGRNGRAARRRSQSRTEVITFAEPWNLTALRQARAARCRLDDGRPVRTDAEAARYIGERGFALLMPIKGVPLPSLSAANGAAPWAEDFQCTDAAWEWKETLPGQKLCSYLKLIRGRGTFVSWRLYPAFYAAYGPVGDPNEEYEEGRLGRAERDLALIVAEHGPLDSRQLWRRTKPLFGGKRSRFTAASIASRPASS